MGAYHGKASFETFSHKRSTILALQTGEFLQAMRYPPNTGTKEQLIRYVAGGTIDRVINQIYKATKVTAFGTLWAVIALILWRGRKL